MMRETRTSRSVKAGCFDCAGSTPKWNGPNAHGTAARHHDATKHKTWVDVYMTVYYGGGDPPDQGKLFNEEK